MLRNVWKSRKTRLDYIITTCGSQIEHLTLVLKVEDFLDGNICQLRHKLISGARYRKLILYNLL